MKRTLRFIFVITMIMSISLMSVYAYEDYGDFDYWYSNSSTIGYFPSTIKVYFTKSSGFYMPDDDFISTGIYGIDSWESCTGITTTNGSSTGYNLRYYGISRTSATNSGIPSNVPAFASNYSKTKVAVGRYNGVTKSIYSISKATVYLVWDTSMSDYNTSLYDIDKWQAICSHEYGHACGYFGHDSGATSSNPSVMYSTTKFYETWGVCGPQDRDYYHMDNVY